MDDKNQWFQTLQVVCCLGCPSKNRNKSWSMPKLHLYYLWSSKIFCNKTLHSISIKKKTRPKPFHFRKNILLIMFKSVWSEHHRERERDTYILQDAHLSMHKRQNQLLQNATKFFYLQKTNQCSKEISILN